MLDLTNITAICIDGRPYDELKMRSYHVILNFMKKNIRFHSIKMIGTYNPEIEGVEYHEYPQMDINQYSKFCLHTLTDYVDSEYCLIFQDDGFIINPHLWEDEFFKYDYIGAPWPMYLGWVREGYQVGNGGFSLRSKKLLNITKVLPYTFGNEDTAMIYAFGGILKGLGIKIAPVDVARRFSVEKPMDSDHVLSKCFGFHDKNFEKECLELIKN